MTTSTTPRPLAVVTGASSGIGLELANVFAEHGYELVVAAEDEGIETVGPHWEVGGVERVRVDLSTREGVEELAIRIGGRKVDAVAINAGIGVGGDFTRQTDLDAELRIVDLNCRSSVHLAKRILPGMVRRASGRVLFTSSIAGTQPGPFEAVYAASKAFVGSLSAALREELKDTGVTVTALMPGPTETNFFHRADMDDTKVGQGPKQDAAEVARLGFEALMKGDEHVVTGGPNKLLAAAAKVLPDALVTKQHRKMSEPGFGE